MKQSLRCGKNFAGQVLLNKKLRNCAGQQQNLNSDGNKCT